MSDSTSPVLRVGEVIEQLRREGVEFFQDSRLEPTLSIPEDKFQSHWAVDSQRCRDFVETIWYEVAGDELPKPKERDFLYMQIREECRKGGRRLSDVEVCTTESNPIVQAVLCKMNETDHFDDRTAILLSELRQLTVIEKRDEIPAFTNIFSRRLNRLIPALRGLGVEVQLRHEEDGSFCKLRRLATFQRESIAALPKGADDSVGEPSAEPSVVNTKAGKDLQLPDGSDGNVRIDTAKSAKAAADEAATTTESEEETSKPNTDSSDYENGEGGAS